MKIFYRQRFSQSILIFYAPTNRCFSKVFSKLPKHNCRFSNCCKKLLPLPLKFSEFYRKIMDLKSVVKIIESNFPPELAEKWDKTGLLIKPSDDIKVSSIFFTIDLTEKVLMEALNLKANMIITYHPLIFTPLSKLISDNWKDRIIMKCVKESIAIYSPHTVCDNVKGGVNDWLINCLDVSDVKAIQPKRDFSDVISICEFSLPAKLKVESMLSNLPGFKFLSVNQHGSEQYVRLSTDLLESHAMKMLTSHTEIEFISIKSAHRNDEVKGVGRLAKLKNPTKLCDCISSIKKFLNMDRVNFALGVKHTLDTKIETIAVCAGSGASVLKDVDADIYLTGEMSHHEVLHATHKNVSVVLVGHSNSERGYLQFMIELMQPQLRNVNLHLSNVDSDPISII